MKACVKCPEYRPGKKVKMFPQEYRTRVCDFCAKVIDKKLDEMGAFVCPKCNQQHPGKDPCKGATTVTTKKKPAAKKAAKKTSTKKAKKAAPIVIQLPPDAHIKIAELSEQQDRTVFQGFLGMIGAGLAPASVPGIPGDFMSSMAVHSLIRQERQILMLEDPKAHPDFQARVPAMRSEYARMRQELRKKLGDKKFEETYATMRKEDDECEIANKGKAKPKFNEDGTHE